MSTCSAIAARAALAVALAGSVAAPLGAQEINQSIERFSVDSVIGVDEFGGQNVSNQPQLVIDISAAMRIGDHWQLYVRPWFRLPRPSTPTAATPPWDKELYQAGVRYERPGPIAVRVDAGYILSPIGLGLLDSRQNLNPTIAAHLTYLVPMPSFAPTGPRVSAIASSYPLGAVVTLSTTHWDARASVINAAPTRPYVVGAVTNPKQTPVFVAGGGVTPITGLRLGVSFAHGLYATSDEISVPGSSGREVTMVCGEGEWAFRYTKIRGEIIRSAFETPGDTALAREWFLQGVQTLAPRWFVAARQEGTSAPPLVTGAIAGPRLDFETFEATAGFRATTEITLRSSYYMRQLYGAAAWDKQAAVSVVFARRWW